MWHLLANWTWLYVIRWVKVFGFITGHCYLRKHMERVWSLCAEKWPTRGPVFRVSYTMNNSSKPCEKDSEVCEGYMFFRELKSIKNLFWSTISPCRWCVKGIDSLKKKHWDIFHLKQLSLSEFLKFDFGSTCELVYTNFLSNQLLNY